MKMGLVKTSAEAARSLSVTKTSRRIGKPPRKLSSIAQSRGGTTIIHASDPSQFRNLVQKFTSCKPSPPPPPPPPSQKPPSRIQKLAPAPIEKPVAVQMSSLIQPLARDISTLIQPVARDGRTSPLSSPGLAALLNAAPKDSNFPITPLSPLLARLASSSPLPAGFLPHYFSSPQARDLPPTPPWAAGNSAGTSSSSPLDPSGSAEFREQSLAEIMAARGAFYQGPQLNGMFMQASNGAPSLFPWSPAGLGGSDMCLGFGFSMGQLSVPSSPFQLCGSGGRDLCEGTMAAPKDYAP